jgi:WD40 repeat protein
VSSGGLVAELVGHAGRVLDLRLSADRSHVLSGAADGTVRLWNVDKEPELCRIRFEASLLGCAVDSTASSMLTASADHVVAVSTEGASVELTAAG